MKEQRNPKRFTYLLLIPIVIVIDIALLTLTSIADQNIAQGGTGHAAPGFSLLGIGLAIALSSGTLVFALLRTIGTIRDMRREKRCGESVSYEYKQVERKDRSE